MSSVATSKPWSAATATDKTQRHIGCSDEHALAHDQPDAPEPGAAAHSLVAIPRLAVRPYYGLNEHLPMADADDLSALIGDVYDAALDPGLWVGALQKIAAFVHGPAAALLSHDTSSKTGGFYYSWGDDPHYSQLYFTKYIKLNPTLVPLTMMDVGSVHSISTVLPFDEFRNSRLYREWAQPQGYGDATLAVLEKSAAATAHLTVTHADRDSPVTGEARRRMGLLVPHVRRAVAIARIIDLHKVDAHLLADAVDAIAAGVFLVRDDASIVRANVAATRMLDARDLVYAAAGRLMAAERDARTPLSEAVAAATRDGLSANRPPAVPLSARDGARYVAHVLPLGNGARARAKARYAAAAAVFVHAVAPDRLTPVEAISQHFSLTPAELRVLIAIVEVGGVPEVASILGVSETTVRTHLRHLFEKTQTCRQADLVRLVAAYANPMVK